MHRTDVAILGGGLAGLALALQLRNAHPDLDIMVVDRRTRPQPEHVSSVGESFTEIGSHYLREVLGLRDHLESEQLPKIGLRFFIGNSPDLADRFELGLMDPNIAQSDGDGPPALPLPAHQVDRARLENEMARRCQASGVRLVEGREVVRVDLDRRGHRIALAPEGGPALEARWVVFAGAGGMPGPSAERRPLGHWVQAAWVRVHGALNVGTWSDRNEFRSRTLADFRRLSTNHLMGEGYWIWLIPLPGDVTSVGAVVDPSVTGFRVQDRESFQTWIAAHDPRVHGELVATTPVDPGDFHRADLHASTASRVFGDDRWAIVGAGAARIGVLYSPGGDVLAIGNSLTTRLIVDDLRGSPNPLQPRVAERFFRGFTLGVAELYRGQYRNFGRPGIVASKVLWDSALYFGFNTILFRNGRFADPEFFTHIRPELLALRSLQARMQTLFREARIRPIVDTSKKMADWGAVDWMMENYFEARDPSDRTELRSRLQRNLGRLEGAARRMEA